MNAVRIRSTKMSTPLPKLNPIEISRAVSREIPCVVQPPHFCGSSANLHERKRSASAARHRFDLGSCLFAAPANMFDSRSPNTVAGFPRHVAAGPQRDLGGSSNLTAATTHGHTLRNSQTPMYRATADLAVAGLSVPCTMTRPSRKTVNERPLLSLGSARNRNRFVVTGPNEASFVSSCERSNS